MAPMETTFTHGNIQIRTLKSPWGKHVEVSINNGDYWEMIHASDKRADAAFMAMHNYKNRDDYLIISI